VVISYYNENDPFAAQWLRNLIAENLIPEGDVDDRSIEDVQPGDLVGYRQCHFFAGIAGWPLALALAGWPEDREVWTGSCPCQPLSGAGQKRGAQDKRHLWPVFCGLIAERRPAAVFGEQVASPLGREWLAGVRLDLEALGYACGAADLCAAGVAAPHLRQRLWFGAKNMADTNGRNASSERLQRSRQHGQLTKNNCVVKGLGDAESEGLREQRSEYRPSGERCRGLVGFAAQIGVPQWNGPTVAVECSDGWRRVSSQPDAFPMAHGVQQRGGKLRAYGNAICPPLAKEFIEAFMECST